VNNSRTHIGRGYLLFKRWSNKSYAIFNSLAKVVHIGFIRPIVSSLVTAKAIKRQVFINISECSGDYNFDEANLLMGLLEDLNLAIVVEPQNVNIIGQSDYAVCAQLGDLCTYFSISKSRPFSGLFYFISFSSENGSASLLVSCYPNKPLFSHE
jgi:hypothetical protein